MPARATTGPTAPSSRSWRPARRARVRTAKHAGGGPQRRRPPGSLKLSRLPPRLHLRDLALLLADDVMSAAHLRVRTSLPYLSTAIADRADAAHGLLGHDPPVRPRRDLQPGGRLPRQERRSICPFLSTCARSWSRVRRASRRGQCHVRRPRGGYRIELRTSRRQVCRATRIEANVLRAAKTSGRLRFKLGDARAPRRADQARRRGLLCGLGALI
jgi:hypothetical protein